jgi:hypothetical protein
MIETSSATNFIVLPQLPRADESLPLVRSTREFEKAGLYDSGFRTECDVQSISSLGATLYGYSSSSTGQQVTLELATGQRSSGIVAWVKGSYCGLSFKQPIDVLALVNRNLLNQPRERRRMPRVELRCTAWLKDQEELSIVTIHNISAGGLQFEGEVLPGVGSNVTLYLEGVNVPPGEIIWRRGKLAGIQLRHELSWALILPWLRNLVRNKASQVLTQESSH